MWFQVLSSAGLMSSSVTTRYASCTHGSAMARTIAEITLTKTPTCVVGWNCHSQTLSFEPNWWIFYKPTLSCYPRENISLSFLTRFQVFVLFFSFLLSFEVHIHHLFSVFPSAAKHPCPPTRPFRCRNDHVCLRSDQVCNKVDDCGDSSDEEECGEHSTHHYI